MYYVFKTYNFFHKSASKPYAIVVISLAAALYLTYIVNTTIAASDLSAQGSILKFVVNIAYPISDIVLLIPISLVILESRREGGGGDLTSIPWVFLSFLIVTIAPL